jgi:hypothetical protein
MKTASYIAVFLGGIAACILLFSLGMVDKVDGIPGAQEEPVLSLPTYLSFLSVMLTAVAVVLTALAIGIGVVAAFTFRGIKEEVQTSLALKAADADVKLEAALRAVDEKAATALSEEAIIARIDKIAISQRQNPTVAELEVGFDPEDNGNR